MHITTYIYWRRYVYIGTHVFDRWATVNGIFWISINAAQPAPIFSTNHTISNKKPLWWAVAHFKTNTFTNITLLPITLPKPIISTLWKTTFQLELLKPSLSAFWYQIRSTTLATFNHNMNIRNHLKFGAGARGRR